MHFSGQQQLLFTPGPRLGWTFRDLRELVVRYPEPAPPRQIGQGSAASAAADDAGRRPPWKWLRRNQASGITPGEQYQQAVAEWRQRAARHESAELARLAGQPEWGSVSAPGQRIEVFGGTFAGWQSLLAVHGASLLADRQLLVADLTGQHATRVLTSTVQGAGVPEVTYQLPQDLGLSGMVGELPVDQLADAIVESMHAGALGGARIGRAADSWVVRRLASVLIPHGVTLPRLAAAVRTALGAAPPGGVLLNTEERRLLSDGLFPPRYEEQAAESLGRLEPIICDLAAHSADGWAAQSARCTCLVLDADTQGASGLVLRSLVVQWLTTRVSAAAPSALALIVAGADEIPRDHLECLADACEQRGVPLTLLFRHLRNDTARLLGGGTSAFLRLVDHAEADQAAAYLGRHHTFVVSSHSTSRSETQTPAVSGENGTSWSRTDTVNWREQSTRQRLYEYRVDPSSLQNLPEFTMLLADRTAGSLRLRAVEFDLSIASLPRVSAGPLPAVSATRTSKAPWESAWLRMDT